MNANKMPLPVDEGRTAPPVPAPPMLHPMVRLWLILTAALIFVMVLVGGATRLTESGLSIVEWKVVTGTLPPLSEAQWQSEFEAYQKIPQYTQMNRGMSLAEFKTIFWWEWAHRLLGRLIGMVFLLPFLFFLWRGMIARHWRGRLWFIFALGAVQGAVGWWMVASGLSERVSVSQYRLAVHLTLALLIYGAIVRTVQAGAGRARVEPISARLRWAGFALVVLVYLQIYLGALVAGLRAGLIYNTWPLIEGAFIPDAADLFFETPWWRNFFENMLTVQFSHRSVGYLLALAALAHFGHAWARRARGAFQGASVLVVLIFVQITIGIQTLLHLVPIGLGLLHQAVALIVLTIAILHAGRMMDTRPA